MIALYIYIYIYRTLLCIVLLCLGGGEDAVLCLVTKQIIIHKLPKVLVLHIKRFIIGDYTVHKDSTHVSFPPILNMAPYCSNTCLEVHNYCYEIGNI